MEIYAAMIAHLDHQVGRLVKYLKESGQYENTMIVFISDNGPEGNDVANGISDNSDWVPATFDQSHENMGKRNSYTFLGRGWAHVSAGPFARYKSFLHEGGVRVPAIIVYPGQIDKPYRITDLVSIMDIAPTLLEVSGTDPIPDADGVSFSPALFNRATQTSTRRELVMEIYGNRAVWKDDWKLTWDWSKHRWQLFDLAVDPGEQIDVSMDHHEVVQSLLKQWQVFIDSNDLPTFDRDLGYGRYADQVTD
jgi:arylsulfatase